jgi:hypothetical protein
MTVPAIFGDKLLVFVQSNIEATQQCRTAINELDELLATSFRGRSVDRVLDMINDLNGIEDRADDEGMELASLLFDHEDEMKPLDVVFWYDLLQTLGDVADYAEDVGDRLRLLIAR